MPYLSEPLFFCSELNNHFTLSPQDSHHVNKVLRFSTGHILHITDGKGHLGKAQITSLSNGICTCTLLSKKVYDADRYSIYLGVGITKQSDRIEWLIEKCVEIGISRILLFWSAHSERKKINTERCKKIAISAMKQSHRTFLPKIEGVMNIHTLWNYSADQRFIAHYTNPFCSDLGKTALKEKKYLLLIGPEGGFSTDEFNEAKKAGFIPVSLGEARLRTETAGLVGCHLLNWINQ